MLTAFAAAFLSYAQTPRATDTDFAIYFENSVLPLKSKRVNRVIYLPLVEITGHLSQPYTDDFRLETFTVGSPNARLVTTRNSALISVNGQVVLLQNPVRRDDGQWFVPVDFLSQGISRITGIEFRYRPGSTRVFAGSAGATELAMNVQALGPLTRLTLRAGAPLQVEIQRETPQRTVILLKGKPIDPLRERLDYKDRLVDSIVFEDADGVPKILAGTAAEVHEVRPTSTDEGRVYFIDFLREAAVSTPVTSAPPPSTAARPDVAAPSGRIRLVVIDPGHGGDDTGTTISGTLEKELTLAIARKLRGSIQNRLGATVLLTRDSDVRLSNEARAAAANSSQADLFISLHIGYSANSQNSSSSIYIIQDGYAENLAPDIAPDRMFLPWYLAYRNSRPRSDQLAQTLQQELLKTLPDWKFFVRTGPIGVLATVTMPSIAVEIGNLNNPSNVQSLVDDAFQAQLSASIAAASQRFAANRSGGQP